ncbi:MAG: 5-formyltetrahydrofolate cyclo-ligase, partial [Bacilli bacterium]|nr:5-formyltetrahydrofolate cyclo-ligase [Bacilli bacterium]
MKKEIRKKYLNIRKNINNKTFKDNLIYQKMITNKKIINSEAILIYVSTEEEIDTLRAINYFINKKKIAVPKIENNEMNFYYINSLNELRLGYFNIL